MRVGGPAQCHPREMTQLIHSEIATQPLLLPQRISGPGAEPTGLVPTPSLAPVPPVTNLDPHLTATMTTLSR